MSITLFTCPKAFQGEIDVIQRNAVESWKALGADCDIVLVAAEEDTARMAAELGVRCTQDVETTALGTPLLPSVFRSAESLAEGDFLAYVNADIMLSRDFIDAIDQCRPYESFMMVGERLDTNIVGPVRFESKDAARDWFDRTRPNATTAGEEAIDYFVFRKGFFRDIPPFALGRTSWDNWILYYARSSGARLIDASQRVTAIHQNHDYTHAKEKTKDGVWGSDEAEQNRRLAGGNFFYLYDANYELLEEGIRPTASDEHIRRRMQRLKEYRPRRWRMLLTWTLRYRYCRRAYQRL